MDTKTSKQVIRTGPYPELTVQTVASGVNGASSGLMFSVPAIFILGYGTDFNPVLLTFGAIAGAFLNLQSAAAGDAAASVAGPQPAGRDQAV